MFGDWLIFGGESIVDGLRLFWLVDFQKYDYWKEVVTDWLEEFKSILEVTYS